MALYHEYTSASQDQFLENLDLSEDSKAEITKILEQVAVDAHAAGKYEGDEEGYSRGYDEGKAEASDA